MGKPNLNWFENEKHEVAMRYYQPVQKYVKVAGGKEYVFVVKMGISMAWVDIKDVQKLLNEKAGCCGNQRQAFLFATEQMIRLWMGTADR